MRRHHLASAVVLILMLGASSPAHAAKPDDNPATQAQGKVIFDRTCLWCHGVTGTGDGPAGWFLGRYAAPRPAISPREASSFRSTPSGDLPTDQDLFRTVTKGIPGYMPGFASLTETERWQVITYVKSFSPAFLVETPVSLPLTGTATPLGPESLDRGRALYERFECHTCHGVEGRGDGPVAQAGDLRDVSGLQIQATDLTRPSSFKNGATLQDLIRTLLTGLDGTPMPSYASRLTGTDHDGWDLAHYIRSLSAESAP